jgi:hypothetical protein
MCGTIERCWLFTFRERVETVAPFVPAPLAPVTRDGFAFWNVVVCEVDDMRPAFAPPGSGIHYRHVAYRLYVRHKPKGAPPLEGLYFLRSDADSRLLGVAGNLLSDFQFHHATVEIAQSDALTTIDIASDEAPGHVGIDLLATPELPEGSPFGSLFEAKAVLKYKPFALTPDGRGGVRVLRVCRDEYAWKSKLVTAKTDFAYLRGRDIGPEISYQVEPIDYRWEKVSSQAA